MPGKGAAKALVDAMVNMIASTAKNFFILFSSYSKEGAECDRL